MTNRSPRSVATVAKVDFASLISTKGANLPNRYVMYAGEGWGKTSFGAQVPKPIFIQSRGETGLETLIDAGQLPDVAHFPEVQDWPTLMGAVQWLRESEHPYKSVVIDTINGLERLLHEHVCQRDFGGDWGDRGFGSYQKGFEIAVADLHLLLSGLDELRIEKRMSIVILAHRRIVTIKNPAGADYDTYQPDVHKTTWGAIAKWSDVILFGDMEVIVDEVSATGKAKTRKGKGVAQNRIIRCESSPAWVAKNRLGLPPEVDAGNSAAEAWANYTAAVKAARSQNQEQAQ